MKMILIKEIIKIQIAYMIKKFSFLSLFLNFFLYFNKRFMCISYCCRKSKEKLWKEQQERGESKTKR